MVFVPRLVQNKHTQSLTANHFPLGISLASKKICRHYCPATFFAQCFEPLNVRGAVSKFVSKRNYLREHFTVKLVGAELIQAFCPYGR